MRYRETGELHLDFHGLTGSTIDYILEHYGHDALVKIMTGMGQQVYRSIYEKLRAGDTSELAEHWQYFFEREQGKFTLDRHPDGQLELTVHECPAVRHLKKIGIPFHPTFCLQTELINQAWSEGTPFVITTEKTGECSCRQTVMFREKKS